MDHHEPNGHNGAAWMDQMASQERRASGDSRHRSSPEAQGRNGLEAPGVGSPGGADENACPSSDSRERWWRPFGKDPVTMPVPLTDDYLLHVAWRSLKQGVFIALYAAPPIALLLAVLLLFFPS